MGAPCGWQAVDGGIKPLWGCRLREEAPGACFLRLSSAKTPFSGLCAFPNPIFSLSVLVETRATCRKMIWTTRGCFSTSRSQGRRRGAL